MTLISNIKGTVIIYTYNIIPKLRGDLHNQTVNIFFGNNDERPGDSQSHKHACGEFDVKIPYLKVDQKVSLSISFK